jgi:acyl-CoA synthetase (AMP-forming)/AMP-acid ligase II
LRFGLTHAKILTTSPRNTVAANTHIFKLLDCKATITEDPNLGEILTAYPLLALTTPSVQELLEIRYPHYPYNKSFEEAKHEPLLAYHSAGSTGMPKVYVWNHDYAATHIKMSQLEPPPGFESTDQYHTENRVFFMLPPFHVSTSTYTLKL